MSHPHMLQPEIQLEPDPVLRQVFPPECPAVPFHELADHVCAQRHLMDRLTYGLGRGIAEAFADVAPGLGRKWALNLDVQSVALGTKAKADLLVRSKKSLEVGNRALHGEFDF